MEQDKINAYMTLYHALVTIAKTAAPMIPFMTEDIYQNLVRSVDKDAPESIHLSFYIHGSDWLTVLDVCCISAGTSQNYDLQKLFHVCFQIFVDPCFVYSWEVAEMDTLRKQQDHFRNS